VHEDRHTRAPRGETADEAGFRRVRMHNVVLAFAKVLREFAQRGEVAQWIGVSAQTWNAIDRDAGGIGCVFEAAFAAERRARDEIDLVTRAIVKAYGVKRVFLRAAAA
jgi:hypothetical protein